MQGSEARQMIDDKFNADCDREDAKYSKWEAMEPDREELTVLINKWYEDKYDDFPTPRGLRIIDDFVETFLELEL